MVSVVMFQKLCDLSYSFSSDVELDLSLPGWISYVEEKTPVVSFSWNKVKSFLTAWQFFGKGDSGSLSHCSSSTDHCVWAGDFFNSSYASG